MPVNTWFTRLSKRYAKWLFYRTWGGPDQTLTAHEFDTRLYRYQRLWDYYQGTAFDDIEAWAQYRRAFALYRQIRLVWDHVHALVEFYATHVWSGTLPLDGKRLPDGVVNAIPLADDTDPALALAIGQLWQWWNFQEQMTMLVRYVAALGEFLVELDDDAERGKVMLNLWWPGNVTRMELDESGNVKEYVIEYEAWDEDEQRFFLYRREVDKERFATYRQDLIGMGAEFRAIASTPNPYGFVPAVWFRHIRIMGNHGEPAIWATQSELDEVNGLFSHIIDKSHISLNAPVVISGNIAPSVFKRSLDNMVSAAKNVFTEDEAEPRESREDLNILEGPAGTSVSTIQLNVTDAAKILDRIISGIERKCPEVTFYEELRSMTQLTGPAASRVLGDVEHKLRSIAGNYDRSLIKLCQMGVAVAGFRVHEGAEGWAEHNDQQAKFDPYDLDSFLRGDLNFDIMPRELVPMTAKERYELLALKKTVLPDLPEVQLAKEGGYSAEAIRSFRFPTVQEQAELREAKQEMVLNPQPTAPARPVGAPGGGPQGNNMPPSRNGNPNAPTARQRGGA